MNHLKNGKQPQKNYLRPPNGENSRYEVPEYQDHKHHQENRAHSSPNEANLSALEQAKQKDGARYQKQLNDYMNGHQDFRPDFQQSRQRRRSLGSWIIDKAANGNFVDRAESDVDHGHN